MPQPPTTKQGPRAGASLQISTDGLSSEYMLIIIRKEYILRMGLSYHGPVVFLSYGFGLLPVGRHQIFGWDLDVWMENPGGDSPEGWRSRRAIEYVIRQSMVYFRRGNRVKPEFGMHP